MVLCPSPPARGTLWGRSRRRAGPGNRGSGCVWTCRQATAAPTLWTAGWAAVKEQLSVTGRH